MERDKKIIKITNLCPIIFVKDDMSSVPKLFGTPYVLENGLT